MEIIFTFINRSTNETTERCIKGIDVNECWDVAGKWLESKNAGGGEWQVPRTGGTRLA